jgi:hypothetical protein
MITHDTHIYNTQSMWLHPFTGKGIYFSHLPSAGNYSRAFFKTSCNTSTLTDTSGLATHSSVTEKLIQLLQTIQVNLFKTSCNILQTSRYTQIVSRVISHSVLTWEIFISPHLHLLTYVLIPLQTAQNFEICRSLCQRA